MTVKDLQNLATFLLALPAILLLTTAPPALAQEAKQGEAEAITVVGNPDERKKILDFVKTSLSESRNGQFARFDWPICPLIIGFEKSKAAVIEKRIRRIAEATNIKTGKEGCGYNVYVAAVVDAPSEIDFLRRKKSYIFGDLSISERNRIMKGSGPSYAWKMYATVTTGGEVAERGGNVDLHRVSRITRGTIQEIEGAFLFINSDALLGLTAIQIADYAAVKTMMTANDHEENNANAPSILSLFVTGQDEEDKAQSVTHWDLALLRSLYSTRGDLPARSQMSDMQIKIGKDLLASQDGN